MEIFPVPLYSCSLQVCVFFLINFPGQKSPWTSLPSLINPNPNELDKWCKNEFEKNLTYLWHPKDTKKKATSLYSYSRSVVRCELSLRQLSGWPLLIVASVGHCSFRYSEETQTRGATPSGAERPRPVVACQELRFFVLFFFTYFWTNIYSSICCEAAARVAGVSRGVSFVAY